MTVQAGLCFGVSCRNISPTLMVIGSVQFERGTMCGNMAADRLVSGVVKEKGTGWTSLVYD